MTGRELQTQFQSAQPSRLLHVLLSFVVAQEDRVLRRAAQLVLQVPQSLESRRDVLKYSRHGDHHCVCVCAFGSVQRRS